MYLTRIRSASAYAELVSRQFWVDGDGASTDLALLEAVMAC